MLTVTALLLLCALVVLIAHAAGHAPLWPAVLLMLVVQLLAALPLH